MGTVATRYDTRLIFPYDTHDVSRAAHESHEKPRSKTKHLLAKLVAVFLARFLARITKHGVGAGRGHKRTKHDETFPGRQRLTRPPDTTKDGTHETLLWSTAECAHSLAEQPDALLSKSENFPALRP